MTINRIIEKHILQEGVQGDVTEAVQFSGVLGCVKDVRVNLDLDPNVMPVRQKLRPLPFHLRDAVSKEINKAVGPGHPGKSHRRHGTNAMGLEHRSRLDKTRRSDWGAMANRTW